MRHIRNGKKHQELLYGRFMEIDINGHSVFNTVQQFFNEKYLICATDYAASMTGHNRGFIVFVKRCTVLSVVNI